MARTGTLGGRSAGAPRPVRSSSRSRRIVWIRGGMVDGQHVQAGDAVAGFAKGALATGTKGEHPDIADSWYVNFLEWARDSGHSFSGVNPQPRSLGRT